MAAIISTAITAGFAKLTAGITTAKVIGFALKTSALLALNALMTKRNEPGPRERPDRTETFASGPARWALGRTKIGGVVAAWFEDWDVENTERFNRFGGGADDVHMVLALSGGPCDKIEAIWIGDDRFNIKFDDEAKTQYSRRSRKSGDTALITEGLALTLEEESLAWWHNFGRDGAWRDASSTDPDRFTARILDEDKEEDAEKIRLASLAQAISIVPYLDDSALDKWRSLRRYTIRDWPTEDGEYAPLWNQPTPFADEWTVNHRLVGIAGVHVKLRQWTKHDFNAKVFRGGVPDISFLIRGLKITHPDPNKTTGNITQWTDNAAAIRYWFDTVRRGIPAANIDRAAFVAAYNVCNEELTPTLPTTWPNDTPPQWAEDPTILRFRKYSINGVISSGEQAASLIAQFDDHWQGFAVEDGGRLFYYPGTNQLEVDTIEGDDLLELPSFTPAPSLAERSNLVTISMAQSSFHDYQAFSLQPVDDEDKRNKVDGGLFLPFDLGSWRFLLNPAHAYSLAIIQLRRARASGTLSLRLPPGNNAHPVKYLEMSAGKTYSITITPEGFNGRKMLLISKSINEDLSVNATFIDSPDDLYDSDYQLPAIPDPPPYLPTRTGSRPYKPDGLTITNSGRVSDDGSFLFRIRAEVNSSPLTTAFRLTAGDDQWYAETEDNFYVFEVNAPLQQMEITVRHIDNDGVQSLPVRRVFTPDYKGIVLPTPRWREVNQHGVNALMYFESEAYTAPISGVEIRFTRKGLNTTGDFTGNDILTDDNWESAGTALQADPVQIVRGLDLAVNAVIREPGRYALFARYVTNISGATQQRGPVSAPYFLNVEIPDVPISSFEEAPLFDGTMNNVVKWKGRQADRIRGQTILIMDNPSTSIPWENWLNPPSHTSTVTPLPAWPFGESTGFNATFNGGTTSQGLPTGGTSAWYLSKKQDLGTARAIEVRADIKAFAPGTFTRSDLTFGDFDIVDQRWTPNVAITPITLPAATTQLTGNITYTCTGLPPGVLFNPTNRRLTGTPTVNNSTGGATYTARDTNGGSAAISFQWTVGAALTAPVTPNQPTVSAITRTSTRVSWTAVSNATSYDLEWGVSGGTTQAVNNITDTHYDFSSLTAGTGYFVRVSASNSGGTSSYSTDRTWTTTAAVVQPSTPTGLTLSTSEGNIVASWTTATNVTSYSIRWKRTNQATYPNANTMTGIGASTYTIMGLVRGQSYDVSIQAHNTHPSPSAWSSDVEITIPNIPNAPTIQSIVAITGSHPGVTLTVSTTENENTLEIGVISDAPDGTHSSSEAYYSFSIFEPRRIFNIFPGYTYQFRARAKGIGYVTAWSSIVSFAPGVHEDAPARVTNLRSTATTHNSISLAWNAADEATSYRIRYWKSNTPAAISSATSTGTSTTITGLDPESTYTFRVDGKNTEGYGLPATPDVSASTGVAPVVQAIAPTGLTATPDSNTSILFTWTESANADYYEIEQANNSDERVSGIVGDSYSYGGLVGGRSYRFKIRAVNTHSPSAYVTFATVTVPSTNVPNPHEFASTTPMSFTRVSNSRNINYSFTAPVRSNVEYFQVRYAQVSDSRMDDFDNDAVATTWRFLPPIPNTQTSGNRTVTGSFDPGFSDRYWVAQVRAYVNANANGYSTGFGEWGNLSNSESYTPTSGSAFNLSSTFHNGKFQLSDPTPSVSQTTIRRAGSDNIVANVHWVPHTDEFELPIQSENKIEWTQRRANGDEVVPRNDYWTFFDEAGTQLNSSPSPGTRNQQSRTKAVLATVEHLGPNGDFNIAENDIIRVKVKRTCPHMETFEAASTVNYTFVDPADVPANPAKPGTITAVRSGRNVIFSWDAVPYASGYEVRTIENRPGVANSTEEVVKQTGSGRIYTKVGGRNETFTIKVRSFNDRGSSTNYSDFTQFTYTAPGGDNAGLGKVTGMVATRNAIETFVQWDRVANASGYQTEYSTDGGTTWLTTIDTYGSVLTYRIAVTLVNTDVIFRTRAVAGTSLSSPDHVSLSWTTLGFKQVPSSESGPGVVRNLVAMSREADIILDWTAAANASRYRLQGRATSTDTWADIATNISVNTTHYQTDITAGSDYQFRVRSETDEGNGAWTIVKYVTETAIAIAAPSVSTSSTYTSITATWAAVPNAAFYDVQYRLNTSPAPAWTSHTQAVGITEQTVTITGLSAGSSYQIRVRGKDGGNAGAWATVTRATLSCDGLSPPSTVTVNAGTSNKLTISWTSVTGATGYRVRIRVGNVVQHTSATLSGTTLQYERTPTQLSSISLPATLQCSVQAIHSDCPNSSYSSESNALWNPGTLTVMSVTNPPGTINPTRFVISGDVGSLTWPGAWSPTYETFAYKAGRDVFNSVFRFTSLGGNNTFLFPYTAQVTGNYTIEFKFENGLTLLPKESGDVGGPSFSSQIKTGGLAHGVISELNNGTTSRTITKVDSSSTPIRITAGSQVAFHMDISWHTSESLSKTTKFRKMLDDAGEITFTISRTSDGASGTASTNAAGAATGATINLGSSQYQDVSDEPPSQGARPYFNGEIPQAVFTEGQAIDAIDIPAPVGGVEPYRIIATGLPGGLDFDEDTRQVTGTPTDSAPHTGHATFRVVDANDLYEDRTMEWVVAMDAPSGGFGGLNGGFGTINSPFGIPCALRCNVKPYLYRPGGTNATDIVANTGNARNVVVWFRCPSTMAHTVRLLKAGGAGAVDYDIVVKRGGEFEFSDSTDELEFVDSEGHTDGAIIGIYRYEATTTTSGANNTGDPLILEWVPDFDAPDGSSGVVGGAVASGGGVNDEATGQQEPGQAGTDFYLYYRTTNSGNWIRYPTVLSPGWNRILSGSNDVSIKEFRVLAHFKTWRSRAVESFTYAVRDR